MATYIMLSSLTEEGAKTLARNPKRIKEVNQEVEQLGAKVRAQYAVLGPYDYVTVIEAKDNLTAAHVSAALSGRGTVKITTLAAVPVEEFVAKELSGAYQQ